MYWDEFDKFNDTIDMYMPRMGEGDTVASQIATSVCKLVYKWFNDGDVYDNTYALEGWCNDLSSYANWLYKYVDVSKGILDRIETINTEEEYEQLLYDLCETTLGSGYIHRFANTPKVESIYTEVGKFMYKEYEPEDDEEYDWF